MYKNDDGLMKLVHHNLSSQEAKDARAYYDTEIKDAGEKVRIGLREVPMPFRGICIFIDLMPNANWGHPVLYFLASEDLKDSVRYEEHFPPFSGDVPNQWRALPLKS